MPRHNFTVLASDSEEDCCCAHSHSPSPKAQQPLPPAEPWSDVDPEFLEDHDACWDCYLWHCPLHFAEPGAPLPPHSGEYCPGNCQMHRLITPELAEMNEASRQGMQWGDLWLQAEEARVAALSAEQVAAEAAVAAAEARARAVAAEAADAKRQLDLKKFRMEKAERDAQDHARWVQKKPTVQVCRFHLLQQEARAAVAAKGNGCLKSLLNYSGPRGDKRTITVEEALEGCWNQKKGKCPFSHGEPAAPAQEMRDFSAVGAGAQNRFSGVSQSQGRPPFHKRR
jgi:hypothetical protein